MPFIELYEKQTKNLHESYLKICKNHIVILLAENFYLKYLFSVNNSASLHFIPVTFVFPENP